MLASICHVTSIAILTCVISHYYQYHPATAISTVPLTILNPTLQLYSKLFKSLLASSITAVTWHCMYNSACHHCQVLMLTVAIIVDGGVRLVIGLDCECGINKQLMNSHMLYYTFSPQKTLLTHSPKILSDMLHQNHTHQNNYPEILTNMLSLKPQSPNKLSFVYLITNNQSPKKSSALEVLGTMDYRYTGKHRITECGQMAHHYAGNYRNGDLA